MTWLGSQAAVQRLQLAGAPRVRAGAANERCNGEQEKVL